jgi:phospholipid/cholesterol/gamma-HCH transport system permease protein
MQDHIDKMKRKAMNSGTYLMERKRHDACERKGEGEPKFSGLLHKAAKQNYRAGLSLCRKQGVEMAEKKTDQNEAAHAYRLSLDDSRLPERILSLAGRLSLSDASHLHEDLLENVDDPAFESLTLDLSGIEYLDSSAMAVVFDIERRTKAAGKKFKLCGLTEAVKGLLTLVDSEKLAAMTAGEKPKPERTLAQIGGAALNFLADVKAFLVFVGDATIAMAGSLINPRSVRWRDAFFYMERAGADALPLVGLVSLLLGLILGFQALMQLKQFGANILMADLVGLSVLREIGPLMTCILVAGRSGSAFAAEIGTMKVSEEIDALVTMGFDPVRFLAVPRILALILVVPLLTIYSDFLGLLGGLIVGVAMGDLTVSAYLLQSHATIHLWDIGQGLVKGETYAIVVGLVGCMRGFQARGSAASVGQSTTSAVVSAIFLIIIVDAILTLMFQYFGRG